MDVRNSPEHKGKRKNIVYYHLEYYFKDIDYLKPYTKIIVALDPDAKRKTLQITSTLRTTFPDVFALNLHDDIKYRTPSDMAHLERFAG